MASLQTVNKLFLFGGQDSNGAVLQDLWQFNPAVGAWSELTPSLDTAQPAARHRPALAYFVNSQYSQGLLIVFGGHTQTKVFNDFWVFDLQTKLWSEFMSPGPTMEPR